MYCRKCGKYIPSNADVCADCAAKEAQYTPVTPIVNIPQKQGSLMNGFGKALTAAILGFVGFFCSLFGYLFSVVTFGLSTAGESTESQLIFSILFWVFAVGLAIPALLFGVRSIKLFIAEKKAGHKKPIPTLALGIGAVVFVGTIAIFALITLFLIALIGSFSGMDASGGGYGSNYY
jgi:hypothetical protein